MYVNEKCVAMNTFTKAHIWDNKSLEEDKYEQKSWAKCSKLKYFSVLVRWLYTNDKAQG